MGQEVDIDDIYNTGEKCEYTGLPIFMGRCDCFIHRKINERNTYNKMRNEYINFNPEVVRPLRKSSSHELLQIEPPVTEDDLKKAYHKMCLKFHPDKGGDAEKFIEIKNAYDELLLCC